MDSDWERLESIIAEGVCSSLPNDGISQLVTGLRQLTRADAAALYLLQLDKSQFVPTFGDTSAILGASASLDLEVVENQPDFSFADSAIQKRKILTRLHRRDERIVTQLAAPVKRGASCLGLLLLQREGDEQFSRDQILLAMLITDSIIPLIEKQSSLQLLQAVQKPIDFHQSLNGYLQDLLLQIAIASGMPMIAIRELDGRALRCIATFGLSGELSAFDLDPFEDFGPFNYAVTSREPVAWGDASAILPTLNGLLERPELRGVRSFAVAPILVGDTVFGTLSFAANARYNYSPLEVAGFLTIANVIGTSISNYRNAQTVSQLYQIEGELAVGLTALEVAQAARHEARNVIESINTELANLKFQATKPKEHAHKIPGTVQRIYENSQDIIRALDKIRDVSKPPKRELMTTSLRMIIYEAAALVTGKISKERVNVRFDGKDISIEAYPERLRHAFLNLFLNSLDAFSARRKELNRTITVQIDSGSANAEDVLVRFADNATGIDVVKLKAPTGATDGSSVAELIFQPGVTSKDGGSGHGLFLVRRIISEHKGSIDLIDYRNGVVFDIKLPKRFSSKQHRKVE
jgi:signal transduction histidine kinase